MIRPRFIL